MQERILGKNLEVSALGYGAVGNSFGYGPFTNEELAGEAAAPFRDEMRDCHQVWLTIENGGIVGLDCRTAA